MAGLTPFFQGLLRHAESSERDRLAPLGSTAVWQQLYSAAEELPLKEQTQEELEPDPENSAPTAAVGCTMSADQDGRTEILANLVLMLFAKPAPRRMVLRAARQ